MTSLAVIYSRISHDPDHREAGVERQEQDCRRMAAQRNWNVLEPVYRENDTSASTRSRKRRPVFDQMLDDLARSSAGVLICYSTSRLTRRPMEYERLIELTSRTGLQIHTVVSGAVQLDTADGRALARVLAVIDAAEAERTSERVTRAKLQRAEQGLWHGGPHTPYGYRYGPAATGRGLELIIDKRRAKLVREACQRVIAGDSLAGICRDWNARGLKTITGAAWRSQGIRKMLARASTAGLTERNGQLHPGQWPAILTRDEWDAARLVLLDPKRDTRSFRQIAKRYPLAGLLYCGLCDHYLVSNPMRGVPNFMCSRGNGGCGRIRIGTDNVERFLLERIGERDSAALDAPERVRIRDALRQLQDDHYDGLIDRPDYLRQSQRLRKALEKPRGLRVERYEPSDEDKRKAFRRALDRVVVQPHPKGRATSQLDWAQRSAVLGERLELIWA